MADRTRTQYLTLAEAAELMSISVKTLRRRIAGRHTPCLPMWTASHPHPRRRPRPCLPTHPVSSVSARPRPTVIGV